MTTRSVAIALVVACAVGLGLGSALAFQPTPKPNQKSSGAASPAPLDAKNPAIRLGSPTAKPKTQGTIRIATYNVENLFDHVDDPALSGKMDDMALAATPERCEALAKSILATQADIVAMEEVESLDALTWFRDTYLKDSGFNYLASIQSGDPRGIEQSVLSKIPFKSATLLLPVDQLKLEGVHPATLPASDKAKVGKPIEMARSPLKVEFVIPAEKVAKLLEEIEDAKAAPAEKSGKRCASPQRKSSGKAKVAGAKEYDFTLLVIHHKSGRDYAYQREAEAKKILSCVQEMERADPAINVMLAGDFNSQPQHEGPQVYFTGGLIDLFADRKRGDTTMMTHATNRTIDFLVANKNLAHEVVMESRFVLGTPLRPANAKWDQTPPPPGYASDHLPVVVDIRPVD